MISSVTMPDPADTAGRQDMLEAGGLAVTEETLRQRLTIAVDLAHTNAVEAVAATNERDELRWQIDHDVLLEDLRTQLADVTAELDRLRSIPELRVGQRVRQVSRSIRRSDASTSMDETLEAEPSNDSEAPRSGSTGITHTALPVPAAVLTVRNRGEAIIEVVSRLRELGIQDLFVVDNASSDPAVAQALAELHCSVTRLDADLGSNGPWASGLMARLLNGGNVLEVSGLVVPDPDCPDDVIDRMVDELRRLPDVDAVQLSDNPPTTTVAGGFRLLRHGLQSRPDQVSVLDAPYTATAVRSEPSEPSERFARLHDD